MRRLIYCLIMATTCITLTACGGGGGGGRDGTTSTPTGGSISPPPSSDNASNDSPFTDDSGTSTPNNAPVVPTDTEVQLPDWSNYEGTLPGSDPDGDTMTFEITKAFVPIVITDPATGAYRYEPLANTRFADVEYRVTDAHGLQTYGVIQFLHALKPVVAAGECARAEIDFGEPLANVWTHPDDAVLFVGFGDEDIINMRRFELIASGSDILLPTIEETDPGSARLGAVRELLVDPDEPSVIYARIGTGVVAVSRDTGKSWVYLENPGYGLEIEDLAVTGGARGYLWAINANGVYRAAKDDIQFQPVLAFADPVGGRSIAAHPSRPERLLVAYPDGSYVTEDAGETWAQIAQPPAELLVSDPHDADRVYANGITSVYLSEDFGQTWTMTGFHATDSDILVADPFQKGRLYIAPWGDFAGVRISDDEGDSFSNLDELSEQVRGIAFTSTGALYATQGNRLVCRPQLALPVYDADSPLTVHVEIRDSVTDELTAQLETGSAPVAQVSISNKTSSDLDEVEVAAWLYSPSGRQLIYSATVTVADTGLDLALDVPPLNTAYTHRLLVTADLPNTEASGAIAWVATVHEAPAVNPIEYAVLSANTLWLNLDHPWFPISTAPGEQRRMVLDVENEGPNAAENVTVTILTGQMLSVDAYGPTSIGQTLDCTADADALTCQLGNMPAQTAQSMELFVTPRQEVTAVPLSIYSDTPAAGVPTGGLDLQASITGPGTFMPGEDAAYTVTITNEGDEVAQSFAVRGVIGPWPVVTNALVQSIDGGRCELDYSHDKLSYYCNGDFLQPGESHLVSVVITAPHSDNALHHVVSANGFPPSSSRYWLELFTGNNSAGLVTAPTP